MKKIFAFLLMLMLLTGAASAAYTAISNVVSLDNENDYASAPASWDTLLGNGSVNYYAWPEGYDLIIGLNCTSFSNTSVDYFSIMAGDGAHAFRSSIGNLTLTDRVAGVTWIGPLESARFMNTTGYLEISSGYITGKVAVLKVAS